MTYDTSILARTCISLFGAKAGTQGDSYPLATLLWVCIQSNTHVWYQSTTFGFQGRHQLDPWYISSGSVSCQEAGDNFLVVIEGLTATC